MKPRPYGWKPTTLPELKEAMVGHLGSVPACISLLTICSLNAIFADLCELVMSADRLPPTTEALQVLETLHGLRELVYKQRRQLRSTSAVSRQVSLW